MGFLIGTIVYYKSSSTLLYLKYTPSGEYNAKQPYNYMVTSQPNGATYINRMVNLLYTDATLNG